MKRIAIFGSGSGTNAEKIIDHFGTSDKINVVLVLSNKADAMILERARKKNIPSVAVGKKEWEADHVLQLLKEHKVDFIVLAGFLKLIPDKIIKAYHEKIINLHPALLPGFGGKDMYGDKVHDAVVKSGTIMSGITIHHVNEHFDEGEIIFQAACHVAKTDTAATLADKIHDLEYMHFPVVIEKLLLH